MSTEPSSASETGPGLQVKPFQGSRREWDALVRELDGGTFCHLWNWGQVFENTFGHAIHRWAATSAEGEIRGILPAVEMKSLLFGRNLLSMPFLNYGGPLGSSRAREALARHAVAFGARHGAKHVELRARRPLDSGLPVSTAKVTVILDLPDDPETLWSDGLKSKVRSQVRRPRKANMTSAFGHGWVDDFYGIFARNMRDLGTPVLPRRLFHELVKAFPEELVVAVVRTEDGETVAGGCGFLFRGEFELTWASSLREYNREAPNMLLYWSLMEEVIRRGGDRFNFGRCTPGSGTHRFKRQWGGRDEQLYWITGESGAGAAHPDRDGGIYGVATSIWQKLPLPVANTLGPWISRGLPAW